MSSEFESGFMVRTPSWHKLENAVLKESPRTWDEARKEAGLEWDVRTGKVHIDAMGPDRVDPVTSLLKTYEADGWQAITRDDTGALLTIRPTSYQVVHNYQFGSIMDTMLGIEDDEHIEFEALMSLYGGRQIVALCYFPTPLVMGFDPSKTFTFLAFNSRHDGQGGIRGIPTNVRVVCANTLSQAEYLDGHDTGFTIRHTGNWEQRIEEIKGQLVLARGESKGWIEFAEKLALWKATPRRRDTYLQRFLPISDAMSTRARDNQIENRERIRAILESRSCENIGDNGYGLLMASTEWSDHGRVARSPETYVSRQLLRIEPNKRVASNILADMAGIR